MEHFEHPRGRHSVQVFQHAVVGQNLHLVVGKNHGEKPAGAACPVARLINSSGRRAAMMPVGDVEDGDSGELQFDAVDGSCVGDGPGGMPHPVVGDEINIRCFVSFFRDQFVKRRQSAISQKYRAGLCVQRFDMTHAVVFFFGPRQLMLFDGAR